MQQAHSTLTCPPTTASGMLSACAEGPRTCKLVQKVSTVDSLGHTDSVAPPTQLTSHKGSHTKSTVNKWVWLCSHETARRSRAEVESSVTAHWGGVWSELSVTFPTEKSSRWILPHPPRSGEHIPWVRHSHCSSLSPSFKAPRAGTVRS
jgi:hypothetical protein